MPSYLGEVSIMPGSVPYAIAGVRSYMAIIVILLRGLEAPTLPKKLI